MRVDPVFTAARSANDLVLEGHDPFPAPPFRRHRTLLEAFYPADAATAAALRTMTGRVLLAFAPALSNSDRAL
jgi:hypothetical protein